MSKYFFTKQRNNTKTNVWYNSILIGQLDLIIKEEKDIDWAKYRADKTLKMSIKDRWHFNWSATTTRMMTTIGVFSSKEEAADAILEEHKKKFLEEASENVDG